MNKNMHMTYKQDFYKTKETELDDLFLEYLVPVMEDLEHPTLIRLMLPLMKNIYKKIKSYNQ